MLKLALNTNQSINLIDHLSS